MFTLNKLKKDLNNNLIDKNNLDNQNNTDNQNNLIDNQNNLIDNQNNLIDNQKIKNIEELSPKIRKRVKSMDNFFKFQWSWTL